MKKTCALAPTRICAGSGQAISPFALCAVYPPSICHAFSTLGPITDRIAKLSPDKSCSVGHVVSRRVRHPAHPDPNPQADPDKQTKTKSPAQKKKSITILVADDEPNGRYLLGKLLPTILKSLGVADSVTVLTAPDGGSALTIFEKALCEGQSVDLVITDFHMPGMQGDALIKRIRALQPDIKVIVMSGGADEAVVSGLDALFVSRPFDIGHLGKLASDSLKPNSSN